MSTPGRRAGRARRREQQPAAHGESRPRRRESGPPSSHACAGGARGRPRAGRGAGRRVAGARERGWGNRGSASPSPRRRACRKRFNPCGAAGPRAGTRPLPGTMPGSTRGSLPPLRTPRFAGPRGGRRGAVASATRPRALHPRGLATSRARVLATVSRARRSGRRALRARLPRVRVSRPASRPGLGFQQGPFLPVKFLKGLFYFALLSPTPKCWQIISISFVFYH